MLKRDLIFWSAWGLFALGFILMGITQNQYWLALGGVGYLLRPTLASLGIAKKRVDERQMSIHYRSGNIGFAVMMTMCVICMAKLELEGNHSFELFAMTIVAGLAAKALFNVILVKNYRQAASKVLISAGLLIALFASLDGGSFVGVIMQALPWLAVAGLGLVAQKYPRVVGVIVLALTALFIFVILSGRFRWGQVVTAVVIGVPLILAGVCLFLPEESEAEGKHE